MVAGGSASSLIADGNSVAIVAAIVGAVIAGVFSLIAASMNNRAAAKRDRMARASQRQPVVASTFITVALVIVAVVVGFHDRIFGKPNPTREGTAQDAATCPSQADLQAAHTASLDKETNKFTFDIPDMPHDGTPIVLQFVARQDTGKTPIIVSICRDASSGYFYFSHYRDNDMFGVVTSATTTDDGFEAHNGGSVYEFSVDRGTSRHPDLEFVILEIKCAEPGDVPQAFVDKANGRCTADAIDDWAPQLT